MFPTAQKTTPIERQHTCVACGGVFRYPMANVPAFWASDPERARETHPCPSCGAIQPGMVPWAAVAHMIGLLVTFLAGLVLTGLSLQPLHHGPLAWVGIVLFTAVALTHVLATFYNPNGDLSENRERARREVAEGRLQLLEPGTPNPAAVPRPWGLWHLLALVLILPAPLAFLYPLSFVSAQPEPPTNPHMEPAVVTTGDEVRCILQNARVAGVGPWRGQPTVRVLNAREIGAPETLKARGSNEQWGNEVKVYRPRGSGPLSNSRLTPIIHFTLPEQESLGGKELRLEVTMPMAYVVLQGRNSFSTSSTTLAERLSVKLAPVGYAQGLKETYLIAMAVAVGLALLGGVPLTVLASCALKQGAQSSGGQTGPLAAISSVRESADRPG